MGTSLLPFGNLYYLRDHPHAYGDKRLLIPSVSLYAGSSPRVWGQVNDRLTSIGNGRIIPTRMGTSAPVYLSHNGPQDHPHAYGDKLTRTETVVSGYNHIASVRGSSPRVWGQVDNNSQNYHLSRIIPTRMGTSG